MPKGWICPRCTLVLAPTVAEHRCDPPGAVTAWPTMWPAPTPGTATAWPASQTVTITQPATTLYPATSTATATTGILTVTYPVTAGSSPTCP